MTEQRVLCSARLCQHQLKVGILNPNTSLSTKTEHSEAGLHKTAEQQGQDNCCKHKYSQGCWQVSLIKFLKKECFVYYMLEKYGKTHIVFTRGQDYVFTQLVLVKQKFKTQRW